MITETTAPEHEAMAEWVATSAHRRGLRADLEHSSAAGGIRTDVLIDGGAEGVRLGVEIHYARAGAGSFNPRSGLSRTTRIMKAGISPLWVAPSRNRAGIAERLPSAITNDLPVEAIRTSGRIEVVSGPGQCDLQEHNTSPDACPKRGGRRCTGWHPRIVPMQHELGAMIEKVAGGELIIIRRRARVLNGGGTGFRLHYVPPAERDKYLEHGGVLVDPALSESRLREQALTQTPTRFTDEFPWDAPAMPPMRPLNWTSGRALDKTCAFAVRGDCEGEVHLYINGTWCSGHRP